MAKRIIKPAEDGVTHINMYSAAQTEFGRMLSDFAPCEIDTPEGKFQSVEGYWYYLSLPAELKEREQLKWAVGYKAKRGGRDLRALAKKKGLKLVFMPDFEDKILAAIRQKVRKNKHLWKEEYKGLSVLHYYVGTSRYNGYRYVKDMTDTFPWLCSGIEKIVREECE